MLTKEEIAALVAEESARAVADAMKADREAQKAEREAVEARKAETKEAVDAALKAQRAEFEDEAKKANRLPYNRDNAPVVGKFGDLRKFDDTSTTDTGNGTAPIVDIGADEYNPS